MALIPYALLLLVGLYVLGSFGSAALAWLQGQPDAQERGRDAVERNLDLGSEVGFDYLAEGVEAVLEVAGDVLVACAEGLGHVLGFLFVVLLGGLGL